MRVRLGYVAIALKLPKVTSSSTVTFKTYSSLISDEERLNKLKRITLSNIDDLYKILEYNVKNKIHFYRITSALVPLATHPEVTNWDYRRIFKKDFQRIGRFIKEYNMRIDTHPDQFNVINSKREEVVEATKRNLYFHVNLFEDIGYTLGKMVLHIGSAEGGKDKAIERFIVNFKAYPKDITEKLILENDDKTFTVREVLHICKSVNAPMVLDIHHHVCNNEGEDLEDLIEDIFNTWSSERLPIKIHVSSPRDDAKDRKHADYIEAKDFIRFIEMCKPLEKDIDVMIEAKKKDLALYKLAEDIKSIKSEWKWIDDTTFEI
ncbi:UV DNA damage repair endonuclease UvsE [Clostridium bovifaecis]|uniref:UV DNA damage repair endonuclease UvsE n=1 Tax=Clostridium bovifaecis TaxID=2184719 RepID=A0A6I6ETK1_9CLOT|nr:UV DNA damage repair endonuclease UvsE [Clostridium bovifaecis]